MNFYVIKTSIRFSDREAKTGYAGYDIGEDDFEYLRAIDSPHLCVFDDERAAEAIAKNIRDTLEDNARLNRIEKCEVSTELLPGDFDYSNIRKLKANAVCVYTYLVLRQQEQ